MIFRPTFPAAALLLSLAPLVGCAAAGEEDGGPTGNAADAAKGGDAGPIFAPEDTSVPSGDDASTDTSVAPTDTFTPPATRNIWTLNGYCGSYGGACPSVPACPVFPDSTAGQTCSVAFERCLVAGTGASATKIFACVPTGKTSWDLNSLYLSAWGAVPGTFPACPTPATGLAGADCTAIGDRCVTGEKLFRCLPGGFKMWVFNGHCSTSTKPITWAGDCAASGLPTCTATSVAGSACSTEFDRCITDNKIFRCVSR